MSVADTNPTKKFSNRTSANSSVHVIIIATNERYKISFWNEKSKMKTDVKKNTRLPDRLFVFQIVKMGNICPAIEANESENVIISMETSVIWSGNKTITTAATTINNVAPVMLFPFS